MGLQRERDVWKLATTIPMAQSVMTIGDSMMLRWCADNSDTLL